MDLNRLLFKHQLAQMNADRSGLNEDRKLARTCAGRIADWRVAEGLPIFGWPGAPRSQAMVR
ncbi:MAG: hypothetical protein EP350_09710 [Alphaproteobacteria bacterium]|nr:MAG: hypothetical protein EP350_09710 [Alphaproteobacteria bacterium]